MHLTIEKSTSPLLTLRVRVWTWLVSFLHTWLQWRNICRSRGNLKFTCQKSLPFFSSRICQQLDAILRWFVEYNVSKEGLFEKRLGISRSYLNLVNWINIAFDREKEPKEFSRTANSTVWPLLRNGSTNFVCTCMIIWSVSGNPSKTFLETIKEIS